MVGWLFATKIFILPKKPEGSGDSGCRRVDTRFVSKELKRVYGALLDCRYLVSVEDFIFRSQTPVGKLGHTEECDKLKTVEPSSILAAFFYIAILNYQSVGMLPNSMDGHISSSFAIVPA